MTYTLQPMSCSLKPVVEAFDRLFATTSTSRQVAMALVSVG